MFGAIKFTEENAAEFSDYQLQKSGLAVLVILTANLGYLVLIMYFLTSVEGGPEEIAHYHSTAIYTGSWAGLNFFAIILLISIIGTKSASPSKLWIIVGETFLVTRAIVFFRDFVSGSYECKFFNLPDLNPTDLSYLVLMIMLIDLSQMMIFTTAMFPSPWIIIFTFIEMLIQITRSVGCIHKVPFFGDVHGFENTLITIPLFIAIFSFFSIASSMVYEINSRNFFLLNKESRCVSERKMSVVNMLCDELKLPLYDMINSIQVILFPLI